MGQLGSGPYVVGRLWSGRVRASARSLIIPRLVGHLGSGPYVVGRLWSGRVRASARSQIIPRLVGHLGSGPYVVGRLWSGRVRASACSQIIPRLLGCRLGSGVRVSASLQIFALTAGECWGGKLCEEINFLWKMSRRKCPTLINPLMTH